MKKTRDMSVLDRSRSMVFTLAVAGLFWGFASGAPAQKEHIDNWDFSGSVSGRADGETWGEYAFWRFERVTNEAGAVNTNAFWCRNGVYFTGKATYGYDPEDCGTAQSIIPCPEPGASYIFAARARVDAPPGAEGPGRVFLEFVNSAGVSTNVVEFLYTNTNYVTQSKTFVVPADAVWCRAWILKYKTVDAEFYVDRVSLQATVDDTAGLLPPTDLSVEAKGSTMARLQWTPAVGASGYLIERKADSQWNYQWKTVFKTLEGGSRTNFLDAIDTNTDNILQPGIRYNYRISSYGDFGDSAVSPVMSVTMDTRAPSPGNTAYYIDATGGDDLNDGLSALTPWKSFIPLDRLDLAPGDQVLLKRGETWGEPMHLHGGGAPGVEIRVGAYGSATNRPVVNPECRSHAALRMIDVSHCRVSGLELSNYHPFFRKKYRSALLAGCWQQTNVFNLAFENLYINRVRGVANRGTGGPASKGNANYGLRVASRIRASSPDNRIYGVSVSGCIIENVEQHAMSLFGIDGITVLSNRVDRAGFESMLCSELYNGRIAHNYFNRAGWTMTVDDNAGVGFYKGDGMLFEHNLVNQTYNRNSGQSLNLDGCDNWIVQYNFFKDSSAGTFVLNSGAAGNIFRYNISQGGLSRQWMRNLGGQDTELYNNVVYLNETDDPGELVKNAASVGDGQVATNVWVHNNIFYKAGGTPIGTDIIYSHPDAAGIVVDNNVYYGPFSNPVPEDTRPKTYDPLFIMPGSGTVDEGARTWNVDAYQLLNGSPGFADGNVMAGNGGQDYWGNPLPVTTPSMGAYEPTAHTVMGIARDGAEASALAMNGVDGWITPSSQGIRADASSIDGTFGDAYGGAVTAVNGAYDVRGVEHSAKKSRISVAVTNNTGMTVSLESLLFDYSQWHSGSPTNISVNYLSGDLAVTNNTPLAMVTVSGPLAKVADYEDFAVSLTNLTDYTLAQGEHAIFRMEASNATGKYSSGGIDNVAIAITAAENYGVWAAKHGLYGSNVWNSVDSDSDGMDNFTEYLIGGDPNVDDAETILPGYGIDGSWLDYVYRRRSDYRARGLSYTVEATTNLVSGSWTTNGVLDTGIGSIDAEMDSVTNRVSVEEHPEQFIRLRVE